MALLKARRRRVIDKVPRRFVIAGHFTRADLTTFADFGFFKRRIGAVRKSYATTEIPLQLSLASSEGPVRCSAMIVDTMMLTPTGTSVETIGNLLGEPKVNLPDGYSKDRMDLFLQGPSRPVRKIRPDGRGHPGEMGRTDLQAAAGAGSASARK